MGSKPRVFLRDKDGKLHTAPEIARLLHLKPDTVYSNTRGGRRSAYGYEVVHIDTRAWRNKPCSLGYDDITTEELYMHYLDCRTDRRMLRLMEDFAGTRDVRELIPVFERRYQMRLQGATE